jgi:hypothetical protein
LLRCATLEERLLHRVLCVTLVAQDAQREAVRDTGHPVVELGEGVLVSSRDERYERFVREVGVVLAHGEAVRRPVQR